MAIINKQAPKFELEAYHEGKIKKISLDGLKGKWVVLVFYPADFTFVCPTELGELEDNYPEFKKLGAEILSISTDKAFTHVAWKNSSPIIKKITYPMLADPTGNTCREYGTYIEEEGVSLRATFIIDPEGILKVADVHDNSIGRNAKEILRRVQAAKYVREHGEQACPAGWKPGEKTLKPGVELVGKL